MVERLWACATCTRHTHRNTDRHSGGSIKLISGQPDGLWYRWKNKWFYDVQQHTTDFPEYIRREKIFIYILTPVYALIELPKMHIQHKLNVIFTIM